MTLGQKQEQHRAVSVAAAVVSVFELYVGLLQLPLEGGGDEMRGPGGVGAGGWEGPPGGGAYLVVNTYVGHIVVPGCNDTGNSCIHINHYCHRYEKGAHGREDDVALVLVVAALPQIPPARLVPAGNRNTKHKYN